MENWLKFHFKKNLNNFFPPTFWTKKMKISLKQMDKNHRTPYCPLWKFIVWQLKCWQLKLWQRKNLWPQKGGDWNFGNKKTWWQRFGDEKFVMIENVGDQNFDDKKNFVATKSGDNWKRWWPKNLDCGAPMPFWST